MSNVLVEGSHCFLLPVFPSHSRDLGKVTRRARLSRAEHHGDVSLEQKFISSNTPRPVKTPERHRTTNQSIIHPFSFITFCYKLSRLNLQAIYLSSSPQYCNSLSISSLLFVLFCFLQTHPPYMPKVVYLKYKSHYITLLLKLSPG